MACYLIGRETLRGERRRSRHLGAHIGATLVLRTRGSHPPSSCSRYRHRRRPRRRCRSLGQLEPGFFLPVRVLSRYFRRRLLEELLHSHGRGELRFFGEHVDLSDPDRFAEVEWVVHAKRSFAGPEAVLAYLSRYTHRVAISNSRLIARDELGVTFVGRTTVPRDERATKPRRSQPMSSCDPSCCMCCRVAFTASTTTAYSAMGSTRGNSPPHERFCMPALWRTDDRDLQSATHAQHACATVGSHALAEHELIAPAGSILPQLARPSIVAAALRLRRRRA